jgi:hypothetical protein
LHDRFPKGVHAKWSKPTGARPGHVTIWLGCRQGFFLENLRGGQADCIFPAEFAKVAIVKVL